jgi:uncharacterized protein (DUF983 family)
MSKKPKDFVDESKIQEAQNSMKKICPHCGRKIHFYAFEKKDRQLCDWCGKYIFKDDKAKFKYRLKEKINEMRRNDGNTRITK